jgi:DNA polymerase
MSESDEVALLKGALKSYLEELAESGVDELPYRSLPHPHLNPPLEGEGILSSHLPFQGGGREGDGGESASQLSAENLAGIRADLGDCQRCPLCASRKNIVFGSGSQSAKIIFVGEAPGRDEDLQGEPFVGEAGQLLTRMIKAMGYERDEVYICNVLKCRPPENRNPALEEIAHCSPFLLRQVQAVAPKAIIALGTFAAQTLLGSKEPISRLRGTFHEYHSIPLMPTFHPAFLLRSPEKKREVWSDLQQVMKLLVE